MPKIPYTKKERLDEIMRLFWQGHRLSTETLSSILGASKRVVQKDIKELREEHKHLNIQKEGKSYFILPEDVSIAEESQELAKMSATLMSGMFAKILPQLSQYTGELFKLPPKRADAFLFDFVIEPIHDDKKLSQMVSVIEEEIAISFSYTSKEGSVSTEIVYPLKIANFNGYWYLIAYHLSHEKMKTYYLKELGDIKIEDESYLYEQQRQALLEEAALIHSPWVMESLKQVKLKAEGYAVIYLQRKILPNITIIEKEEGSLLLEMTYYHSIEVMQFVKSWLPYVTIIEDELLQKELTNILQDSLKHYR